MQLHYGMACLACDWLIYDWCLSKCVIVSFVVIGYHCNHLDGQLNCQAFTHCIISRATKLLTVQSVIVAWHTPTTALGWLVAVNKA